MNKYLQRNLHTNNLIFLTIVIHSHLSVFIVSMTRCKPKRQEIQCNILHLKTQLIAHWTQKYAVLALGRFCQARVCIRCAPILWRSVDPSLKDRE